ncbi:MAG: hypothetical protein ABJO57_11735 [Lentilitoribacter sp.]
MAEQKIIETIEKGATVLDLSEFSYLSSIPERAFQIENLNRLNISGTRISNIDRVNTFKRLEHFNIRQTRVQNISVLAQNKGLTSLDIGATRVFDLSILPSFMSLNRLQMDRTFIQSLCPLNDVENLDWVNLYSSYSADGSQSCFKDLERDVDEVGGGNSYRQNYVPGVPYLALVKLDRFLETYEWKAIFNAIQSRTRKDG